MFLPTPVVIREALAVAESTGWYNLLYVPAEGHGMEEAIGRGTLMLLTLRQYNISVSIGSQHETAAVEASVRLHTDKAKSELVQSRGQMEALTRGLPINKKAMPTGANETDPDQTLEEARARKQSLLAPLPAAPEAKVLSLKRKDPPSTRGGKQVVPEAAVAAEKASQERASQRAKKQKVKDVAEAAAKAAPKAKVKHIGLAKPKSPKKAAEGAPALDLSYLTQE